MANWFREEIDHLGDRLEQAIEKAGHEISTQRHLTKSDMEYLIRFAAQEFGNTLDQRIAKAQHETSELVNQKITLLREQLQEAAVEQKRSMMRNALVIVGVTILMGLVSLLYKKYFQGNLELIDIVRSALLGLAAGYAAMVIFRYSHAFLVLPRFKRNAVVLGLKYLDVLRPRRAWGHLLVFILILGAWAILNYSEPLLAWLERF